MRHISKLNPFKIGRPLLLLIISVVFLFGCKTEPEKSGPLTKSDLVGTKWHLSEISYGQFKNQEHEYVELSFFDEKTTVTVNFDDSFLGGHSFCGTYRTNWQMDEEYGRLTTQGEVAQSSQSCSGSNQELEQAFIGIMGEIGFAELNDGNLEVKSIEGGVASFSPAN